ncbi:MAG: glutamate-cysteine ligase family protein [Methanomicrobiales archaeon]|nr:glutamate-cysteine ligase family protein [Methanomicrobiales archaeon]
MTIGTEHEYSINDPVTFRPLPISDLLISEIAGRVTTEVPFGSVSVGKELQKHVLEIVPAAPARNVGELGDALTNGVEALHARFGQQYAFMGLGMHPLLQLGETCFWDHGEREIFSAYDRVFDLHQHGWLNIQALQVNIPYRNEEQLISLYHRIRELLPYLVAVTAASPFVEGGAPGPMDNRIWYYRENQDRIPLICHGVIPEEIRSVKDYMSIQEVIYRELAVQGAEILCREWVNSRGVIIRFSRCCLEIKAIDEQESIFADMAVTSLVLALLRAKNLELEKDENALRDLLDTATEHGTAHLRPELEGLYAAAEKYATKEELHFLPLMRERIQNGCLAEVLVRDLPAAGSIRNLLPGIAGCLRNNTAYHGYEQ